MFTSSLQISYIMKECKKQELYFCCKLVLQLMLNSLKTTWQVLVHVHLFFLGLLFSACCMRQVICNTFLHGILGWLPLYCFYYAPNKIRIFVCLILTRPVIPHHYILYTYRSSIFGFKGLQLRLLVANESCTR